jgi:hypothetical protein
MLPYQTGLRQISPFHLACKVKEKAINEPLIAPPPLGDWYYGDGPLDSYVLTPHVLLTPEAKALEEGQTTLWTAIEISGQLSRSLVINKPHDDSDSLDGISRLGHADITSGVFVENRIACAANSTKRHLSVRLPVQLNS